MPLLLGCLTTVSVGDAFLPDLRRGFAGNVEPQPNEAELWLMQEARSRSPMVDAEKQGGIPSEEHAQNNHDESNRGSRL